MDRVAVATHADLHVPHPGSAVSVRGLFISFQRRTDLLIGEGRSENGDWPRLDTQGLLEGVVENSFPVCDWKIPLGPPRRGWRALPAEWGRRNQYTPLPIARGLGLPGQAARIFQGKLLRRFLGDQFFKLINFGPVINVTGPPRSCRTKLRNGGFDRGLSS